MDIIENKALRFQTDNPAQITTCIPESRDVGDGTVVVRWGVSEAHALKELGLSPPSPIMGRYTWTGRYTPFDHQKTTAAFFVMNQKAFCFSEMGTGKTASAIWAADYLMNMGIIKRVLVVCPLSIMDSAWRADLFSFAMHRRVDIAYGAAPKRRKIISGNAEFVIINYDGIQIVEKEVAEGGFDLIIIDEANHYKNPQTKRWKCLNRLVTEDTWLWMMTGTPAAQSPVDAYGIAKLVNRGGVPRTSAIFRDMVMRQLTKFKWTPKETAVATVHEVLQPAIRYTKEECLDLPDMVYMKRHVDMTKQQTVYYERLRKDLVMEAAGEEVSAVNAAIMMNKLLQISAGAVYTDEKDTVEFDISNRYNVLREVIDESSHKTLVFVPFKSTIRMLAERLRDDGVTTEVISGDVSANARTEIFKRFQETPDPQVLVVQPQAAAHGVTLTAANTVVWWAPTASLETFAQANARVHRAGQKNKCTVVQLSSSTAEKKLYAALTARDTIHREIVDLYKEMLD
tara:strand:+ start:4361 stop:5896 length:1536 start_codon:yes stop_codon:yes gene_type:complete